MSNTIQEFIEKAIEGGWRPKLTRIEYERCFNGGEYCEVFQDYHFLLDPKAWEAVGKIEEWNQTFVGQPKHNPKSIYAQSITPNEVWTEPQYKMHKMIDHLYSGGTIEEFIKTI